MPFSDLSQYFISPELSDIFMCRPYVKLELPYDADMSYYVMSKYVTNFIMFYPGIGRIKEDKDKRSEIFEIFFDSTRKVLKNEYNIKTKIPRNINNSPTICFAIGYCKSINKINSIHVLFSKKP